MKLALVHDWFTGGVTGADRVIEEMAAVFPEAPVYSLLHSRHSQTNIASRRIQTSFLQRLPESLKQRRRYLLPLIPRAVASLDLSKFDVILSNSSAFVKNITVPKGSIHICYCNSPMRFAWDYRDKYLVEQKLDPLSRRAASSMIDWLKRWDLAHLDSVNVWLANSINVAERIQAYYHKPSKVVYPPVDTSPFKPTAKKNFYLTISTLTPYKKIDLAISAFNAAGRQLYVVGDGPQRRQLEKMAGPNVKLLGYISEDKKRRLLAESKALIFPSVEDFGIAPVEAMASGTPVVAFNKGGLTESVVHGKTGILFDKQTADSLNEAVQQLEAGHFKATDLIAQARKFDSRHFRQQIKKIVEQAISHVTAN